MIIRRLWVFLTATLTGCSCGSSEAPVDAMAPDVLLDATADDSTDVLATDADAAPLSACVQAANEGSVFGCDYVAFSPPRAAEFPYGCTAAIIINTSASPITITGLRWNSVAADVGKSTALIVGNGRSLTYAPIASGNQVPPNTSAIVSLVQGVIGQLDAPCPMPPVVYGDPNGSSYSSTDPAWRTLASQNASGPNKLGEAFRLTTSEPVVVYQAWPYTSGEIDFMTISPLRAVPSWGSSYVDIGTFSPPPVEYSALKWTAIVTASGGTNVSIPAYQAGTIVMTLPTNSVLAVARADNFVGSTITASEPFQAWTGTEGIVIPPGAGNCEGNAVSLLIPPLREWGHTYVFTRQDNRDSNVDERTFIRVVAGADGTVLSYSPTAPVGAPLSLNAGELGLFNSTSPFVVSSQDSAHPIFVTAHMSDPADLGEDPCGNEGDGGSETRLGSTTTWELPSVEGWGKRYDFFMPNNYPNSEIVMMRQQGGADVTLDCAGIVTGWQAIDSTFEFTRVWVSKDTGGAFTPQGACDNGTRSITSTGSFGAVIFGWTSEPFAYFDTLNPQSTTTTTSYAFVPLTPTSTLFDGGVN